MSYSNLSCKVFVRSLLRACYTQSKSKNEISLTYFLTISKIYGFKNVKVILDGLASSILNLDLNKKKNRFCLFIFLSAYCICLKEIGTFGYCPFLDCCIRTLRSKKLSTFDKIIVEINSYCLSDLVSSSHNNLHTNYVKCILGGKNYNNELKHQLLNSSDQNSACLMYNLIRSNQKFAICANFFTSLDKKVSFRLFSLMFSSRDCNYSDIISSHECDSFFLSLKPNDFYIYLKSFACYLSQIDDLFTLRKFLNMKIIAKHKTLLRTFCESLALHMKDSSVSFLDDINKSIMEDISLGSFDKCSIILELNWNIREFLDIVYQLMIRINLRDYHSILYTYLLEHDQITYTTYKELRSKISKLIHVYSDFKKGIYKRVHSGSVYDVLKVALIFVSQNQSYVQKLGYVVFRLLIPFLCEKSYGLLIKRITSPKRYPCCFLEDGGFQSNHSISGSNSVTGDFDDETMLKMDTVYEQMFRHRKQNNDEVGARYLKLFRIMCESSTLIPSNLALSFATDLLEKFTPNFPTTLVANCLSSISIDKRGVSKLFEIAAKQAEFPILMKSLFSSNIVADEMGQFFKDLTSSSKKMQKLCGLIRSSLLIQNYDLGSILCKESFAASFIQSIENLPKSKKHEFCKVLESYLINMINNGSHIILCLNFINQMVCSQVASYFPKLLTLFPDGLILSVKQQIYKLCFDGLIPSI